MSVTDGDHSCSRVSASGVSPLGAWSSRQAPQRPRSARIAPEWVRGPRLCRAAPLAYTFVYSGVLARRGRSGSSLRSGASLETAGGSMLSKDLNRTVTRGLVGEDRPMRGAWGPAGACGETRSRAPPAGFPRPGDTANGWFRRALGPRGGTATPPWHPTRTGAGGVGASEWDRATKSLGGTGGFIDTGCASAGTFFTTGEWPNRGRTPSFLRAADNSRCSWQGHRPCSGRQVLAAFPWGSSRLADRGPTATSPLSRPPEPPKTVRRQMAADPLHCGMARQRLMVS